MSARHQKQKDRKRRDLWQLLKAVINSIGTTAGILCSNAAFAAPLTVSITNEDGTPAVDVVVYAIPLDKDMPARIAAPIEIAQKGRQFAPMVTVIQTGSSVLFPNQDTVRHHVYSFSEAKIFELKLYGKERPDPVVFERPGLVILGCNIHDQMIGYVRVVNTPYFGVSNIQGSTLLELPAGNYRLLTWNASSALNPSIEQSVVSLSDQPSALRFTIASR